MAETSLLPSVFVLVLSSRAELADTAECLASLQESDYPSLHIVLIDNGSLDDTLAAVRARFAGVEIIENGRNLGFAPGNNVGISYALDHTADYIFLLNNDTVVDTAAISRLVALGERHPNVGIIGPVIGSYFDHTKQYLGGTIYWEHGAASENYYSDKLPAEIIDTDYVSGCALMIKSSVVRKIGLLDPAFFIYFEDVDWSIRCIRAGYRAVVAATSVIYHKGTPDRYHRKSELAAYYLRRNQILFMRKYGKLRDWPGFIKAYARQNLLAIQAAIKEKNLSLADAIMDGCWAGICGRFGEERIRPAPALRFAVVKPLGFWLWLTGWLYFWDYRKLKRKSPRVTQVPR